mmetsp:Transcript_24990/g.54339  ORF Transcript_24990/g.54339 Transcript_24990/m.54339 type:complete len:92 (+) Transcript_24990:1863-2138(+)
MRRAVHHAKKPHAKAACRKEHGAVHLAHVVLLVLLVVRNRWRFERIKDTCDAQLCPLMQRSGGQAHVTCMDDSAAALKPGTSACSSSETRN